MAHRELAHDDPTDGVSDEQVRGRHDDDGRCTATGLPQVQVSTADVDAPSRWWVSARVPRLTGDLVCGAGEPQDRQRQPRGSA
ncbi:MAG: hypothetical protein ACRDS0_14420 [Pseudonocardiaceae bacterium]